ncbi:MAG: (Fe-S)-binding protein [Candidatus Marinimicrobia bacterium]|nr:(Fe-S)-binding protein [Candidatus Neomarinimicrobiota bacterium]MCF7839142.1 (Fe-S)-binding protein [Candidatus Neomarinimicrobiota bacterium]
MKVHLFIPCLVNQFTPQVGSACLKLLRAAGHEVVIPANQTCCGQPAFNSGYWDEARDVAQHFQSVFQEAKFIVGPSGSCISMLKNHYAELGLAFPDSVRIFEIIEFLSQYGENLHFKSSHRKVAMHDACHALRELNLYDQPRSMLRRIPDLELVELNDGQVCCGFGGTFSVKMPQLSLDMAYEKVWAIQATGVDTVVSLDGGCLMNIQSTADGMGITLHTQHVAEVLAEALVDEAGQY